MTLTTHTPQSAPCGVETPSGALVDLANPNPDLICIDDIARALANTCRFAGNVRRFYSVASHAILVRDLARAAGYPQLALAALHHDSHEALLGDIATPTAVLFDVDLTEAKQRLDRAVGRALGIDPNLFCHPIVKDLDRLALYLEARRLQHHRGATLAVDPPAHLDVNDYTRMPVRSLGPWRGRRAFLAAHRIETKRATP
jgi:hypothetical protein